MNGVANDAIQVRTTSIATNANHYLTFVNSNNGTAAYEDLYTDAGIYYNPSGNNLFVSGDITAFASDIRLKKDIEPIQNALDKVSQLSGFTYSFNEELLSMDLIQKRDILVFLLKRSKKFFLRYVQPSK